MLYIYRIFFYFWSNCLYFKFISLLPVFKLYKNAARFSCQSWIRSFNLAGSALYHSENTLPFFSFYYHTAIFALSVYNNHILKLNLHSKMLKLFGLKVYFKFIFNATAQLFQVIWKNSSKLKSCFWNNSLLFTPF